MYRKRNKKLSILKEKAMMRKGDLNVDSRSVLPFPITTSREVDSSLVNINTKLRFSNIIKFAVQIGWLSSKQEFQLEIFGPYFLCLPTEMKHNYKEEL